MKLHPQHVYRRRTWPLKVGFFGLVVVWVGVVLTVDPEVSGRRGMGLFYGSLWGVVATGGWLLVRAFSGSEPSEIALERARRWGMLLATLAIGLLLFQQYRVLLWWVAALWATAILLIEFFLYRSEIDLDSDS